MSILEVKNLTIQFGGLRAVDDFNLSLEKVNLMKKVSLIVLTLLLLLFTACQRSDVWRPDFSGDFPGRM